MPGGDREGMVVQFHPQSCKVLDKGIALDILQLEPSRAFDTGSCPPSEVVWLVLNRNSVVWISRNDK